MKLTTRDIIGILPFEHDFKAQLYEKFDAMTADEKFNLSQILWKAYYTYYMLKLQENIELAMIDAKQANINLDSEFYDRIKDQTKDEIMQTVETNVTEVGLESAREELTKILQEKNTQAAG